jgi:hypothetical protein
MRPFCLDAAELDGVLASLDLSPFKEPMVPEEVSEEFTIGGLMRKRMQIRRKWAQFAALFPDHPTVRVLQTYSDVPFERTGWGLLSMLLPSDCNFTSQGGDLFVPPELPHFGDRIWIRNGLYLQGVLTNQHLAGSASGLITHLFNYHSKLRAMWFLSHTQVVAKVLSGRRTCTTFSLLDCMTPQTVQDDISGSMYQSLCDMSEEAIKGTPLSHRSRLAIGMQARDSPEGSVLRYLMTPQHAQPRIPRPSMSSSSSPSSAPMSIDDDDDEGAHPNHLADHTFQNQASLLVASKCKGTIANISLVYQPSGQQSMGPNTVLQNGAYGRTHHYYNAPNRYNCLVESEFAVVMGVYGPHDRPSQRPSPTPPPPGTSHVPWKQRPGYQASAQSKQCKQRLGDVITGVGVDGPAYRPPSTWMGHLRPQRGDGCASKDIFMRRGGAMHRFQRSCTEATTTPQELNTSVRRMNTHIRYQGFNNRAGFATGLNPSDHALHAYCARASLVAVVSNTSQVGYSVIGPFVDGKTGVGWWWWY